MLQRLIIGSLGFLLWVTIVALGQKQPPNYSQETMPVTSFSCRDKIIGGYYADPETDCQMFHVCVKVPGLGVQDYKFLCPNDTSFDQENQICDDWFSIDCEASTLYYSDNFDLYRIGGDIPRTNLEPRLPNNNINNAVSEVDDDYLQKSDRGESVGSDLLRGSHTSNFFTNKNRGREEDGYTKNEYKKGRNSNVKKLLTGKRPIASTQAPAQESEISQPQYRPKTHNFAGRISQFQRTQQQSTEAPSRITETYNRQAYTQRSFYSPTTPKIDTTPVTQRTDFFRNYNPTTKRSYYEDTQNYNTQTTPPLIQTTKNYQNFRTTTTQAPTTVNYYETTINYEKNNNYETQKLFKLNTGTFNQYDDSKDEFLKTAPSLNLGASAFNSLQNSFKNINTSVSSSYNFNPIVKSTTDNYQSETFFNPTTQTQNYYNPSTSKPYQQDYYTTPKSQPIDAYKQNFYNPQIQQSTTINDYQYSQTTKKPYLQQQYTYSTEPTYSQYNPTTLNTFQNQYSQPPQPTKSPIQQYNNQPFQNYQTQNPSNHQATFQPQRSTSAQPSFQQAQITQKAQQQFQPQQNPTNQQVSTNNYYSPTTLRPFQTVKTTSQPRGTKATTLKATDRPRLFTQDTITQQKDQKKEKEQYDYAYYDDGTQSEYDNLEQVDFSRTRSKN